MPTVFFIGSTNMINQVIEFITNHWELVALFAALLVLVLYVESKSGAQGLTPAGATTLINNDDALLIDIRPAAEFRNGHITNSKNIPADTLKTSLASIEKYKTKPVILVCKTGMTAGASSKELQKSGFTSVYKMKGGIAEWQAANLPLVKS